jgi:tetratricopeptide (TPR) repeat protein
MPWLLTSYVRLAAAQVQLENFELAVATLQTAFQVLSDGAVAIPPSAYAEYVEQGDRYAQNQAYRSALAEYDQALRVIEQKCACGLENWSVLP